MLYIKSILLNNQVYYLIQVRSHNFCYHSSFNSDILWGLELRADLSMNSLITTAPCPALLSLLSCIWPVKLYRLMLKKVAALFFMMLLLPKQDYSGVLVILKNESMLSYYISVTTSRNYRCITYALYLIQS